MNLDDIPEEARDLYHRMTAEDKLQAQAFMADADQAIAEGRCNNTPKAGCGRQVTPDRANEWAEEHGYPPIPEKLNAELMEAYQRGSMCPACAMNALHELLISKLKNSALRKAGVAGLN